MFVYSTVPAAQDINTTTSAMYTTSSVASNIVDHIRFATGANRNASIQAVYVLGRGAGLTAISGIALRILRYGAAATAGTAATPHPRDPSSPASATTASTLPTVGSTATVQVAFGCGAAGPGGWVAPNPDSVVMLAAGGGANGNADLVSGSGTTSLNFDASIEHFE